MRFLTDARRRHPHHSDLIDCDPVWRGRVESSVAERSKRQTPWPPHPNPPGGSVVMDAPRPVGGGRDVPRGLRRQGVLIYAIACGVVLETSFFRDFPFARVGQGALLEGGPWGPLFGDESHVTPSTYSRTILSCVPITPEMAYLLEACRSGRSVPTFSTSSKPCPNGRRRKPGLDHANRTVNRDGRRTCRRRPAPRDPLLVDSMPGENHPSVQFTPRKGAVAEPGRAPRRNEKAAGSNPVSSTDFAKRPQEVALLTPEIADRAG